MAPEQFSGQPSAATDIYSFGVIAYEMITGRRPFVADDAIQLSVLQRSGVKVKPAALRPAISGKCEKVILQALHYNPNDRPVSARAFGDALSEALLTSQSSPSIQMPQAQSSRLPIALLAGGVALVVLCVGSYWMFHARSAAPAPAATPAPVVAGPVPVPDPTAASDDAVELAFWNSIGSSSDPRLYREYLAKYPQGKFASIAKLKLQEQSEKAAEKAPAAAPVRPSSPPPAPPSNLAPLRPQLKPAEYAGPLRGELIWTGSLSPGATLTIQGGQAGAGRLIGDLPRVPVTVELIGLGFAMVEQPSAANQFDRIVVRDSSSTPMQSFVIRWRVAK
jgi:serine/threonine-protein kinase